MEKLLDSDWPRAVQFKCNTSAKSVTSAQKVCIILDYDWLKDKRKFSKPAISCKIPCEKFAFFCRNTSSEK